LIEENSREISRATGGAILSGIEERFYGNRDGEEKNWSGKSMGGLGFDRR